MKKSKPTSSFINIGSSSLLIIFLILSLVTFSVLSLSSAQSDYNLSKKLASHKEDYYAASVKAETIVGKIDESLSEYANISGENLDSYRQKVAKAFDGTQMEGVPLTLSEAEHKQSILFSVPMSDSQALSIELIVTDYSKSETYYEIEAWQVISTKSWENDQSIQLIPMEE